MQVFQINLVIYQNGEPSNLMIDLSPHLYVTTPDIQIPFSGELCFVNGELFYVCDYYGTELVLFVREIESANNCVKFQRAVISVF